MTTARAATVGGTEVSSTLFRAVADLGAASAPRCWLQESASLGN